MSSIEIGHARPASRPALPLFSSLATGRYRPNRLWNKATFRAKFTLRALLMPGDTYRLLNMLAGLPQRDAILHCQPRLPCRLHHPYLSVHLSRPQIVEALTDHYRLLSQLLPMSQYQALYTGQTLTLATLCGKNDQIYSLRLAMLEKLSKEGDLSIALYDQNDILLSACTFSFIDYNGAQTLFIGGLQGRRRRCLTATPKQPPKPATVCSPNVCWPTPCVSWHALPAAGRSRRRQQQPYLQPLALPPQKTDADGG